MDRQRHAQKVRRYRDRRKSQGMKRLELTSVPASAESAIRLFAERVKRTQALGAPKLALAMKVVNAPLPRAESAEAVLAALLCPVRDPDLTPHIVALFREVDKGVLHDLVIAGAVTFDDLRRALRLWLDDPKECPHAAWIDEMADLELARDAA